MSPLLFIIVFNSMPVVCWISKNYKLVGCVNHCALQLIDQENRQKILRCSVHWQPVELSRQRSWQPEQRYVALYSANLPHVCVLPMANLSSAPVDSQPRCVFTCTCMMAGTSDIEYPGSVVLLLVVKDSQRCHTPAQIPLCLRRTGRRRGGPHSI